MQFGARDEGHLGMETGDSTMDFETSLVSMVVWPGGAHSEKIA